MSLTNTKIPDVNLIEQICSSFISLTCPIWSRKNSIGEKTFYQCMGKVFLLKKKKSILGDPGAGSRVVLKGTGMKVFKHLLRLFSRPDWLPLGPRGWKKRKTSNFSFNIHSLSVAFLSNERPNLDIYFDQKWWRICWFEVSGNLRGCLHEKTRTGVSFIPGWLFDFLSRLHDDGSFHISIIRRYTSCW